MCGAAAAAAFSKVKAIRLILFRLILALAAGCSPSPDAPGATTPSPEENAREYVHKNGLTIELPEKFSVEETSEGFIIEPAGGANRNVRYPIEAQVILKKDEIPPSREYAEQKTIGNRTIKYRINQNEGGSGGAEYNLTANEQIGDSVIYYSQSEQSEDVAPHFKLCWTIIENTSLKN